MSGPAPCQRSQLTVTFSEPMTPGTAAGGASNTAADALTDASGVATSLSSCSALDARSAATSGSVTCLLARPVAAGSDTLTIGSSSAPTDVAGNALSPASVTVSFR